ncbi:MAG: HAMP domain-containing protein, partial [Deltaproteobacteria bacterium]|nr:HAMP domain-containing protein [Deltaproteobacteria bacterium]
MSDERPRRPGSEGLDAPTTRDTPPPDDGDGPAPATGSRPPSDVDLHRKIGSAAEVSDGGGGGSGRKRAPTGPLPHIGSRSVLRTTTRLPRLATPSPAPELRQRMRTKLVAAMVFAALVPVGIVAVLAVGVILSSLEAGLREDADRQLTVGLNLVLRAVERIGGETVQLSESPELPVALRGEAPELEAWLAREASHVPSARLQLIDTAGRIVFERTLGGNDARFVDVGVVPGDPAFAAIASPGSSWTRGVSLVTVGDRVIVRAVAPVVDAALTLRGALVLSTPLDGDFADAIKGALSADVLVGGPSGTLVGTFRSVEGAREEPIVLAPEDREAVLRSKRVVRDLDVPTGTYKIAATALNNASKQPVGIIGVAVDRAPLAATKTLAVRTLIAGGLAAVTFALVLALFWSRRLGAPIVRLHRGAIAVSRGDLDHRIDVAGADELADLATAFNQMTSTLKDNQARLAARMREIVALHDAGRAVSSVIDLDSVSRKIVDAVARTFDVQLAALWLADGKVVDGRPKLRASAARARRPDVTMALATDEALAAASALADIAEHVRSTRAPLRLV